MPDPDVAQHARAEARDVALEDASARESEAVRERPESPFALRLAGVGAAATPPPWMGGDRGTAMRTLGTIQRTAGNRAACLILDRRRSRAAPGVVAQREAAPIAPSTDGASPVLGVVGRGGGTPLDERTRTSMEQRLGSDFSDVRVHTGGEASRSAESVGANAYTVGSDIVFRDGQLSDHTLAHELTHVQQQREGPVDGSDAGNGVRVSDPSDRFELAAERTAQRVMASASAQTPPSEAAHHAGETATPTIQRLVKPPEETAVMPASGRKPPGPGNSQVADFIRTWKRTPQEKAASASAADAEGDVGEAAAAHTEPGVAATGGAAGGATGGAVRAAGAAAGTAAAAAAGVAGAAARAAGAGAEAATGSGAGTTGATEASGAQAEGTGAGGAATGAAETPAELERRQAEQRRTQMEQILSNTMKARGEIARDAVRGIGLSAPVVSGDVGKAGPARSGGPSWAGASGGPAGSAAAAGPGPTGGASVGAQIGAQEASIASPPAPPAPQMPWPRFAVPSAPASPPGAGSQAAATGVGTAAAGASRTDAIVGAADAMTGAVDTAAKATTSAVGAGADRYHEARTGRRPSAADAITGAAGAIQDLAEGAQAVGENLYPAIQAGLILLPVLAMERMRQDAMNQLAWMEAWNRYASGKSQRVPPDHWSKMPAWRAAGIRAKTKGRPRHRTNARIMGPAPVATGPAPVATGPAPVATGPAPAATGPIPTGEPRPPGPVAGGEPRPPGPVAAGPAGVAPGAVASTAVAGATPATPGAADDCGPTPAPGSTGVASAAGPGPASAAVPGQVATSSLGPAQPDATPDDGVEADTEPEPDALAAPAAAGPGGAPDAAASAPPPPSGQPQATDQPQATGQAATAGQPQAGGTAAPGSTSAGGPAARATGDRRASPGTGSPGDPGTSAMGELGKRMTSGDLAPAATGFPEKGKQVKTVGQLAGDVAKKVGPKGGGRPAAGGGKRRGGGGGAPAAPKPIPLGDAALEGWRASTQAAIAATKPADLGEAKQGPEKLAAKGKDIEATRKAAEPDYAGEAKAKTPPMPAEPPKEQTLDTSPADAAVNDMKAAGSKRLADQTLQPIGTPPPYPGLNPRDYVPRNLLNEIADLEKELARKDFKPGEKESLTKQLEAKKAAVSKIEESGGKGIAPPSPTVTDKGPASLEAPSPAQAEILGDAIARALGQIDDKADELVKRAVASMKGDQVPELLSMAKDETAVIKTELDTELRGIASAAGVTKEQLTAKIDQQKVAVKEEAAAVEQKLAASSDTYNKQVQERTKAALEKTAGAKEDAQQDVQKKKDAIEGPPDTAAIERKRDEYLGKVTDIGAQATAGYRSSLTKREADLDAAAGTQKANVKTAADNQAAAIRRHWATDPDPEKAGVEALDTLTWGRTRGSAVDSEVRKLKTGAKAESDGYVAALATQIQASKDSVRDWAARQEGKERSWWDRLWDMITDWGNQAKTNTDAWEKQRNADSRDAMMGDLDALTKLREAQATGNQDAMTGEFARLDADRKALAALYFKGGISSIEFVARSTMQRIGARRAPELATKMEGKAVAEWDWMPLGQLAKGKNPSFNPVSLAAKVRGGVAGWGTNESQVYAGLGGARTAVERAALSKYYHLTYGVSMDEDVDDDMDDHEYERAKALMEGKAAEADAAAIKEAVAGLGTDEQAVRDALRGKTPEELEAIKAEYKRMYGKELKTDLAGDMEDAELDNALALADGDIDRADAAELEDAMDGPGTNEEKLQKVYERVREEEEARAKKEGLSPAELQKRIKDRNARVKAKYGEKYGDLDANLRDELLDPDMKAAYGLKGPGAPPIDDSDMKVMEALQTGDPAKIDAAKAYREHNGVYASDDELEKITRNQHKQADLDVNLDLASQRAKLDALKASGDISDKEYETQAKALAEKSSPEARESAIKSKAQANMAGLKGAYSDVTGGTQTFDQLILNETSGYSQLEIQDLVAAGGKLSDAQEIYYSVAGAGTDEDQLKEILKGKTPDQIRKIKAEYARLHPGRSMDDDILSDLSGREDLDVGHTLKYGDPDTFAKQLADEKDPVKRKALLDGMKTMLNERRDFEETGAIGQVFAMGADPMNSAAQLEQAVTQAEKYEQALSDFEKKNAGKKPEEIEPDPNLAAAKANFEMTYGGQIEVQEQVRAQIDAYADVITQVGAAVAGIAVTVATFGAAGPVVAAMYGAAAAAAMTMALKAQLKGAAYSWEEAGVDLAVGAIDAAVSGLTAGMGKAVTGALSAAVAKQVAKRAAKEGAEKATESAVKVWMKEAFEEVIENAVQAMPTAAAQAMLDDNTWKSGDPWGAIGSATWKGAATGAAVGVGMKGAKDLAGVGVKGIKRALKGSPDVDAAPKVDAGGGVKADTAPPKADAEGGPTSDVDMPTTPAAKGDAGGRSSADVPDKPVDLPQAADPDVTAKAAEDGKPPAGKSVDPATTKIETPTTKADAPTTKVDTPQGKVDPGSGKVDADGAAPRKPSTDDVGKALGEEDLAGRYGMPRENVQKIGKVAADHGVIIDIRPTTPHAEPMLREGTALPKPEKLKAKTINEVDVQIGLAKEGDLGKVGFFDPARIEPKRPADFDSLPEPQKKAIDDRIKQRKEEFADYQKDMQKLADAGLIRIEPDGTIVNTGLVKGKGELPFTGDHDVFDIRAKDGTALSPEKYQQVKADLLAAEAGVMHGGVTGWAVDAPESFNTPAGQKSYGKMVADHSPGGKEPLVRIGDGDPKAVWYEPATPRAADAGTAPKSGDAPAGSGVPRAGVDPDAPGPRAGGSDPDIDTKVRDDIEAATGVTKGGDYDAEMKKLREFYENQALEAQDVAEVRTRRIDPMTDKLGRPVTFPDGSPWGYEIKGAFDVRRFEYEGGGVTQVTIKVAIDARPGVGAAELARLKADVHAGVDAHYNKGQTLPNGDRLNVRVEFVDAGDMPHLKVEAGVRGADTRADQTHWFVGDDPTVHAHELGHQMGLLDEYLDPRAINRSTPSSAGVKADQSLMGNFWSAPGVVDPGTSLKERHLKQIAGDVEAARAGRATATPTGGAGPAAPAPDLDLPPMPELSGAQMDRMGALHEGVGGAQGWADLGFHSLDDMRRHFARFGSADEAIGVLEIRARERAELRAAGPAGFADEGSYWDAQVRGLQDAAATPPVEVDVTNLPEYRMSIEEASDRFARLPDIEGAKNVAMGGANEPGKSGWAGDQAEATERAFREGMAAGHETEPHMFDPRDRAGQYESSHSERKAAAGSGDQHFASSKDMCPRCQDWFAWRAKDQGLPQFVADPTGVRVFLPDGRRLRVPHPSGADTVDPTRGGPRSQRVGAVQ